MPAERPRIALATAAGFAQLAVDDRALVPVLERLGAQVDIAVWNDPVSWQPVPDAVVIRSCWWGRVPVCPQSSSRRRRPTGSLRSCATSSSTTVTAGPKSWQSPRSRRAHTEPHGFARWRGARIWRRWSGSCRTGEWSLVFFAGRFSHAVLKRPAAGDFRVQAEHGGSTEAGGGFARRARTRPGHLRPRGRDRHRPTQADGDRAN